MAAAHGEIAGGAVAAAVGAAPRGPARFIERRRRWGRLEYRGIGMRDVRRHGFAFGRKAERRVVGAADPAAAIDEGIEHHVQELVGELECHLLCAGRGLAGKLVQGIDEIAAGQPIERHECWRQRAAVVEEVVDRTADVELVDGEGRQWRAGRILRRRRQPRYRWQGGRPPRENTIANELRPQVEVYAVVEIIQPSPEVARQAECLQILEPARAPVVGRQNCVAAREIDAWEEDGRDGAVQRGAAAHIHPPATVIVPGELPGTRKPPALTTVEPTVPLPKSTAPLFTVVRLDDTIEPFTASTPAFTVVVPV